jgi:hypothetical protein
MPLTEQQADRMILLFPKLDAGDYTRKHMSSNKKQHQAMTTLHILAAYPGIYKNCKSTIR